MTLVDEVEELEVPERLAASVRWLVKEAAQVVEDAECTFKVVIHLGRGQAPTKTVIERHQIL
jgi:hypothetical protein